jgi:hypothetical protein
MSWKSGGLTLLAVVAFAFSVAILQPTRTVAQTPASLDDETMLSLVLPQLADGSRPGVHFWARADQYRGSGDLPTVFVVTLYTRQGATGPEEREIVNLLQYANGGWAPARPRDDGTLLLDDWAWLSLNLKNLAAATTGQGESAQYIVDYSAAGSYNGTPRDLSIEEVYASDLSLVTSTVLSDTSGNAAPSGSTGTTPATTPTATAVPRTAITATPARVANAGTPVRSVTASPTPTRGVPSGSTSGANTIHPGSPTP